MYWLYILVLAIILYVLGSIGYCDSTNVAWYFFSEI